jgi:hypothetical protein
LGFKIRTKSSRVSRLLAWNVRLVGAALALALVLATGDAVRADDICPPPGPPAGSASCQPKFNFNGYDKGAKTPINNCQTNTSQSPCAWADVSLEMQNFLACSLETTGPIALCYYSGVPGEPNLTPSCTFSQAKNSAQCDCYKISKGNPTGAMYSYVLITSILNKKVYADTVSACGSDGSGCLNATNIGDPAAKEAPVCAALRDKTVFPGADVISDFSPILIIPKGLTSVTCPTGGGANLYAGCMTAPCKDTGKIDPSTGLPLVKCTCPIYDGPNQVGNLQINSYSCSPAPHVWSSAYSAPNTIPTEP